MDQYIHNANADASQSFIYKVVVEENHEVIGHIHLQLDRLNESARIGKVLIGNKSFRGHGIGQLTINQVLAIAFDKFKLHRVRLGVLDFNHSAIACYEKAGFIKEGLTRDNTIPPHLVLLNF